MKERSLELEEKGKELAKKYWNMDFNLPVFLTDEIKNSLYGAYAYKYIRNRVGKVTGYSPDYIMINSKKVFSDDQLIDLLKHELCHWACQQSGKPFLDGSKHFESELYRIGATSTRTNFDKEVSTAYQTRVIEGKETIQGNTEFSYKSIHTSDYKSEYFVYYKGVNLGTLGNYGYGKYRWNPSSPFKEFGSMCWTARKYGAKALLKAYEEHNGKIS